MTWIRYCTDSEQLASYYRAADLFVHPGVQETFGLVAWKVRLVEPRWWESAAAIWTGSFFTEQEMWATENTAEALAKAIEKLSGEN